MDPTLTYLHQTLPCRSSQIDHLHSLFAYKDGPHPENVFIQGGPSVGKSIVVTTLLEKLEVKHVIVNLVECYSSKILFEAILNKLSGHRMDPENPVPYARCENLMDFLEVLKKYSSEDDLNGSVIVLDKAEELRDMDFNLLPAFMRLRELSGIAFSVILISEIVFQKFLAKANSLVDPIKINFPQYNQVELLEILSMDIDNARRIVEQQYGRPIDFDLKFFKNYLNAFLSVFYRVCRDLSELRYMSRINFVKYCQPITDGQNTVDDQLALWKNVAPTLKSSLEVLYLRIDTETQTIKGLKESAVHSLELPFYAKYLLIAAYLASYNSAKDDKRLFMKFHGKKMKRMKDVKMKSKVSEQLSTQVGPKPFAFDRLLAIFYSILDEKVGFNNNLLVQVSSLVELKLLSSVSDNYFLDGQKFKCVVNYDFIQEIARTVKFNIRKYLSDFSHI